MNISDLPAELFHKVASHREALTPIENPHQQICGVIDFLRKEAGFTPAQVMGLFEFVVDRETGNVKRAEGFLKEQWDGFVKPFAHVGRTVQQVGGAVGDAAGTAWNVSKAILDPKKREALKEVGGLPPEQVDLLYRGAKTMKDNQAIFGPLAKGDILGTIGGAWDTFKNSDFIKNWGSTIVGGLGSFAGAKLLGADTGTAMVAGGAGALAGSQYNNVIKPGLQGLKRKAEEFVAPAPAANTQQNQTTTPDSVKAQDNARADAKTTLDVAQNK